MEQIQAYRSFDGNIYTVEQEARKADQCWAEVHIRRTLFEMVRRRLLDENLDAPDNVNRTREDAMVDFVMSHYPLIVDVVSEVGEKIGYNVLLEPKLESSKPEEAVADTEILLEDISETKKCADEQAEPYLSIGKTMGRIHGEGKDVTG